MIIYQTEEDYLSDFDNDTMTPGELFYVVANKQAGYAHDTTSASVSLFANWHDNAQFDNLIANKIVSNGDVELNGVLKIDSAQVLP